MAATDMAETRAAAIVSTTRAHPDLGSMRRFFVDFGLSLAVFALAAGLIGIGTSNAFPMPPPPELSFAASLPLSSMAVSSMTVPSMAIPTMIVTTPTFPGMPEAPGSAQTLALFALAFATLVATNMAIGRHLLRAYASPRRRRWGKG
jgi:hypothetical protein